MIVNQKPFVNALADHNTILSSIGYDALVRRVEGVREYRGHRASEYKECTLSINFDRAPLGTCPIQPSLRRASEQMCETDRFSTI